VYVFFFLAKQGAVMNLEETKLILEAIGSASAEAKQFGFWWLAINSALPGLLWFAFGVCLLRTISTGIRTFAAAYELAEAVGVDVVGPWEQVDTKSVKQRILALREEANK
jgi:hypothetical protein